MKIDSYVVGVLAAIVIVACVLVATGCTKMDYNQQAQQPVKTA